jgi:Matrixin
VAEGARNRNATWGWWLSVLAVAALVLAGVVISGHGHRHQRAAGLPRAVGPPSVPPGQTAGGGPSTGTRPKTPAAPGGGAQIQTVPLNASKAGTYTPGSSTAASPSAPTAPVVCHTDLPLRRSPNAPYNFMCTQAGRPLTWRNGNINLYVGPLSTVQQLALPAALSQWEAEGHFTVTQVSAPRAANVTMTTARLSNREAGYAQVHYSCTSAACFYDHATVSLSSTATLAQTAWVSTICHELGHAAGLNHVSRHPQVMYPYVNATSPNAYTPGDIQGLQAEYQQRPDSSMATLANAIFGAWVGLG